MIGQEIDEMMGRVCRWHKINGLILKRQKQLVCIHKSIVYNKNEDVSLIVNDLNEMIGVTYLIVKEIKEWYEWIDLKGMIPMMFEYHEQNYLQKIGYDNNGILKILNIKMYRFKDVPNPFFRVR